MVPYSSTEHILMSHGLVCISRAIHWPLLLFGHLLFRFICRVSRGPVILSESQRSLREEEEDLIFPCHIATQEFSQPPHDLNWLSSTLEPCNYCPSSAPLEWGGMPQDCFGFFCLLVSACLISHHSVLNSSHFWRG